MGQRVKQIKNTKDHKEQASLPVLAALSGHESPEHQSQSVQRPALRNVILPEAHEKNISPGQAGIPSWQRPRFKSEVGL